MDEYCILSAIFPCGLVVAIYATAKDSSNSPASKIFAKCRMIPDLSINLPVPSFITPYTLPVVPRFCFNLSIFWFSDIEKRNLEIRSKFLNTYINFLIFDQDFQTLEQAFHLILIDLLLLLQIFLTLYTYFAHPEFPV